VGGHHKKATPKNNDIYLEEDGSGSVFVDQDNLETERRGKAGALSSIKPQHTARRIKPAKGIDES
jgi:hypothetical protein